MDIISKSVLLSALLLLSSTTVAAEGIVIYRWVDEDNVVHFSQHQPHHSNYTEITTKRVITQPSVSSPVSKNVLSSSADNGPSLAQKSLVAQKMAERCQEAKQNIKTLTNFDDVQYTDEDGNETLLSEEDKKQQLTLSQRQVEVYCEQ